MKKTLLEYVKCPQCEKSDFSLDITETNEMEIRTGRLVCRACNHDYPIADGILNLLVCPDEVITKEQAGWTTLETYVTNTDKVMLSLPEGCDGHEKDWKSQADNYNLTMPNIPIKGDETILDLGSGRCWSTRKFAKQGCVCVGIDILLTKYVGLKTADIYINHDQIFFERVCGDMNKLPFQDSCFDIVFLHATLHHSSNIKATLKEVRRVLKVGGRVLLVNEPVVGRFKSRILDCVEVQHGINENVYYYIQYLRALKANGFSHRTFRYAGGYHRWITKLNALAHRLGLGRNEQGIWPPLLPLQLFFYGGILNLVAWKKP